MAELTATTFVTLDGVMQAPGGPDEDTRDGFPHGGWLVPFADEAMGAFMEGVFDKAGGFLLGRRTYEIFAAHWPHFPDPDDPIASRLNNLPKHVVSTTLEKADWQGSTLISTDVVREIQAAKDRQTGGELQIHGSGALVRSLMAHGLIDEYRLLIYPVYLGEGVRLFPEGGVPTSFDVTGTETTGTGVSILTLRPSGPAKHGSFQLDPGAAEGS
jgi:dihydrofolate reductase